MIRFVDLRGQDVDGRFAFFDTVSSVFVDAVGDGEGVVWDTWQEFEASVKDRWSSEYVERFQGLTPEWTRTPRVLHPIGEEPCILCSLSAQGWPHSGFTCCTREELVARLAGTP